MLGKVFLYLNPCLHKERGNVFNLQLSLGESWRDGFSIKGASSSCKGLLFSSQHACEVDHSYL